MGLYIILMGVQGAGKGVQAAYISDEYQIPHVSTGDLFRAMRTREDELAQRVQKIMAEGRLVDDDTTNEVVVDRLSQPDAQGGVIFDGYPRNAAQADFLTQHLAKQGEKVNSVLLLDLDLFVAFKRAFGRFTDAETGVSYNYYYKTTGADFTVEEDPSGQFPPRIVAKVDGRELKRRADDADARAVIKRIDTYLDTTLPVINYYEEKGVVFRVNADQQIEAVTRDIEAIINAAK